METNIARAIHYPTDTEPSLRTSCVPDDQIYYSQLIRSEENHVSFNEVLKDESDMSLENEALTRIFSDLKSKNKDIRLKASYGLLNQVIAAHSGG